MSTDSAVASEAPQQRTRTIKLTPQREQFARHFFRHGNGTRAYRASYKVDLAKDAKNPHWVHVEASKLLNHPDVAMRIEQLREQAARRVVVNASSLVVELEQARTHALDIDRPSAAVAATMGKARITGHIQAARGLPKTEVSTGINIEINMTAEDAGML